MGNNEKISLREQIRMNLICAMSEAGYSQIRLAAALGISKGTVNNWIRGNNAPDVDIIPKICRVLNISIAWLYSPSGDEIKKEPLTVSGQELSSDEALMVEFFREIPPARRGMVLKMVSAALDSLD